MKEMHYNYKREKCLRTVIVVENVILFLLGITVVALGIYLLVDRIFFVSGVYGTQLPAVSCYFIMAAGSIMLLISFFGCFGAIFQNQLLLFVYCIIMSLVLLSSLIGSVVAIVFHSWVSEQIFIYMQESLFNEYGVDMDNEWNNVITRYWDEAQEKWSCCSILNNTSTYYQQSNWYKQHPGESGITKPYVPLSCCVKKSNGDYYDPYMCQYFKDGAPAKITGSFNSALHYKGCKEAGASALSSIMIYFIVIGFVILLFVVSGIVSSVWLYYLL